jgi:hypothetical protein
MGKISISVSKPRNVDLTTFLLNEQAPYGFLI